MNLLTGSEMASLLRCSYQTFNRLVKTRRLPFYAVGRARMFNPDKVLSMLEAVETERKVEVKSKGRSLSLETNRFKEMLGIL